MTEDDGQHFSEGEKLHVVSCFIISVSRFSLSFLYLTFCLLGVD